MSETRRYKVAGDVPFTLFHKLRLPGEVMNLTEKEARRWEQARPGSLEALDVPPPAKASPKRRRSSSRRKSSASSKERQTEAEDGQ